MECKYQQLFQNIDVYTLLGEALELSKWLNSFLTIFFVTILKERFPSVIKV